MSDAGTRLAGLMAGEFDLITNLLPEFTQKVPQAIHMLGLEHPIIILNADGGPIKDIRVRQALNYAVDKKALAEGLFDGYAQIAQGQLLSPSFFGFNQEVSLYPYDPQKAKALLKEAGATGASIEIIGTAGRWLKDREMVEAVGLPPNLIAPPQGCAFVSRCHCAGENCCLPPEMTSYDEDRMVSCWCAGQQLR